MVDSRKKPKRKVADIAKDVRRTQYPEKYYELKPSWGFASADKERWSLFSDEVITLFWSEILPHLQALEKDLWSVILVERKKSNHNIDVESLNKVAVQRLAELHIEVEAVTSLRVTGKHRIYGHIIDGVFHVLWIDLNHGDNYSCVCRSVLKHT